MNQQQRIIHDTFVFYKIQIFNFLWKIINLIEESINKLPISWVQVQEFLEVQEKNVET